MNSNSDINQIGQSRPAEFVPSLSMLLVLLAGNLFAVLLLIFLFKPIFDSTLKIPQGKLSAQELPDPPNVISSRTQPVKPTSFFERIQLATDRSHSKKNMKQIGLAMYNYHQTYQCLPPGGTTTKSGKPYHSWQTSILPFIDQAEIFNKIDFNKSWSDPENHDLFQTEVLFYLNPSISEKTAPDGSALSHFVGNSLLLMKNRSSRFQDIPDGKQHTIMAVDRGNDFKAWGDPTSLANPAEIIGPNKISSFHDGNNALMSDGSVHLISNDIDPAVLKALSTPASGDSTGDF